jgi:hypothetical protein
MVGMVVVGVDAHKRTHTLVAVDQVGRKLAERTVATTSDGHLQAVTWAAQWPQPQVTFALEDCRHLTRRLEADLLRAGHRVVRVPTRLMATARRSGRQPGKSPTRSTRWPSPRRRYGSRTCPSPTSMARPGRSSCWPTTAPTWSWSGPRSATGCAGTCTSSTPSCRCPRVGCAATR